jgi:cardiolipin synthase
MAWFLAMALVPYVGVPLYVLFGGRKQRRRAASKAPVYGRGPEAPVAATAMERLLDGMGVPPASDNAQFELLPTGERAYAALIDLIDHAKSRIHVATFILGGDAVGDSVLEHLTAQAGRGVEVRLLIDGLFAMRPHRRELSRLRQAGGKVAEFMPLLHLPFRGRSNLRNHRKITVVDSSVAMIGGMNLAEEYMGPTPLERRWKDVALRLEGGAASDLDALFREDWAFASGESVVDATAPGAIVRSTDPGRGGPNPVRVVASGPDVATDTLYDAILFGLFSAQARVWIATPYFVPDDALVRALSLACRRGIDVRIVVPTPSNHPVTDLAGAPYLRDLQREGAKVRPYTRGMLHAKVIVIDDAVAMIGSANFDMRSLFLNYEVMALLYGPEQIREVSRWFEQTLALCGTKLPEVGRARAAAEDVARMLGPLV